MTKKIKRRRTDELNRIAAAVSAPRGVEFDTIGVDILDAAIRQLKTTIDHLVFARAVSLPEDARGPLLDHTTRQAIKELNIVRKSWGLKEVS